ncbi:MAG TPA: aminotransferase class III-fold pyridoxal phosphate-dependent enzyme [Burkholderiales bacterium]|nr:aminotransferase class III-fold pyridoxal phosphate-dependent enzyme [Burkholderiales bacterium]
MLERVQSESKSHSRLNPTLRRLFALLRMDRIWEHADGVWLIDADGRHFLDCYAQYGVLAFGHNAPQIIDTARTALDSGEPAMIQPYRARHAEALARRLGELAPGNLSRGIFTTSGAEAVEAAIKLVRRRAGRSIILAARGSFHGKTMGALALTGQRQYADPFGPSPSGVEFLEFGDADALQDRLSHDGDKIAAFFIEPIQGERGVHLPPPGYLKRVRNLCSQYGVALVLDEIQTGLGRTGRLFACEHDGIEPDVLLLGKALGGGLFPLSGCFSSLAFSDEQFSLLHSSTFANNNVACRVGLKVLEILTNDGFCADVERRGKILLDYLNQMAARYPKFIAAVRGRGLMSAIELRSPGEEQGTFLSFLANQGLYSYAVAATVAELGSVLVLPTLGNSDVIRITPPLIISQQELEMALEMIDGVFRALQQDTTGTILRAIGAFDGYPSVVDTEYPGPAPLLLTRLPKDAPKPQYAWLGHYTRPEDIEVTNPSLRGFNDEALRRVCAYTSAFAPGVVMRAPTIFSATGESVDGLILALPILPEEMASRGLRRTAQEINRAVDLAASLGARIVGLGGHTAPYSRRGLSACGRGPAITTGNALTAGMAVKAILAAAKARRLRLSQTCVAVVGARGSVGSLCARLLAREQLGRLVLVGNPSRTVIALQTLANELRIKLPAVEIANDTSVLKDCQIILTATAAARPALEAASLAPGTIICDVAKPPDTSAATRARHDLFVFDGGQVALPDPNIKFGVGNLNNLPPGVTLACLAETILLALAGETRDFGVGYNVSLAEVDHILTLASRHGFHLASPRPTRDYSPDQDPTLVMDAA